MSHVIVDISEEVICDSDEESVRKIGNNYMKLTKWRQLQAVPPLDLLIPRWGSNLPWVYVTSFTISGIYSTQVWTPVQISGHDSIDDIHRLRLWENVCIHKLPDGPCGEEHCPGVYG